MTCKKHESITDFSYILFQAYMRNKATDGSDLDHFVNESQPMVCNTISQPKEKCLLTGTKKVGHGYNTDDFSEQERLNGLGHGR